MRDEPFETFEVQCKEERGGGRDEATCESNAKGNKVASKWEWKQGTEGEQHQVACWTHLKTVGSWLYELPLLTKGQSNCGSGHYAS